MPRRTKNPNAAQVSLDITGYATVTYFERISPSSIPALRVHITFKKSAGDICRTALVEITLENKRKYPIRIEHQSSKKAVITVRAEEHIRNPRDFLRWRCKEIAKATNELRRRQRRNQDTRGRTRALIDAIAH